MEDTNIPLFVDFARYKTCSHVRLNVVAFATHNPASSNTRMVFYTTRCSLALNAPDMIVDIVKFVNGGI